MAFNGEWWIDETGSALFADGDIADQNHEMFAFWGALEVDAEELDEDVLLGLVDRNKETFMALMADGTINNEAAKWFMENPTRDARDYAMEKMNWIRVESHRFQMQTFNDDAKNRICDFIGNEQSNVEEDDELTIEQYSDNKMFSLTVAELRDSGKSAAALLWAAQQDRPGFYNPYEETEEVVVFANPSVTAPRVDGYEGMQVHYDTKRLPGPPFRNASRAFHWAMKMGMLNDTRERLYAIYLDQKNKPMGYRLIGAGGVAAVLADPKVVFGPAMALHSPSLMMLHNHPSGSARPSKEDIQLTEDMKRVAATLGIRFLDHIVVGRDEFMGILSETEPTRVSSDYLQRAADVESNPDIQFTDLVFPGMKGVVQNDLSIAAWKLNRQGRPHHGELFSSENWVALITIGTFGQADIDVHRKVDSDEFDQVVQTALSAMSVEPDTQVRVQQKSRLHQPFSESYSIAELKKYYGVEIDVFSNNPIGIGVESNPLDVPETRPDEAYDPFQLEIGTKIEAEHTADREIARTIAKDHLDEMSDYYSRLIAMEKSGGY